MFLLKETFMSVILSRAEYKRLKTSQDSYTDLVESLEKSINGDSSQTRIDVIRCGHPDCNNKVVTVKNSEGTIVKTLYMGCENLKHCNICIVNASLNHMYCDYHYVYVSLDESDGVNCITCYNAASESKTKRSRINIY